MAGVKGKSGGPRKNAGGKRAGAGRKPKKAVPHPALTQDSAKPGKPSTDMLQWLQDVALGKINANQIQVRAAVAAVQYTHVKKGEGGKKDAKKDAALAAAGKFASAPAPPRLAAVGGKPV